MALKSNISELKAYSAKVPKGTKPKLDHSVDLYADKKIASFKSALNTVVYLINIVAIVMDELRRNTTE